MTEHLRQPGQVYDLYEQKMRKITEDAMLELAENGGSYHRVDLVIETIDDSDGSKTKKSFSVNSNEDGAEALTFVSDTFSAHSVAEIIDAVYNVLLLKDYDLTPTRSETEKLSGQLVDILFEEVYTERESHVEHCGPSGLEFGGLDDLNEQIQKILENKYKNTPDYDITKNPYYNNPDIFSGVKDFDDIKNRIKDIFLTDEQRKEDKDTGGEGCVFCGEKHAGTGCPNPAPPKNKLPFYHGGFTCPACCALTPDGIDAAGNEKFSFSCSGHRECLGHNVLVVKLKMHGVDKLIQVYFQEPVDALLSIPNRTPEQEAQLQDLLTYLEILEIIMNESMDGLSGSLSAGDLAKVELVAASRAGNRATVETALSQAGGRGGRTYWSWYGFSSRVEWCACFVSWCLNQNGYAQPKFSACESGVKWCRDNGKWREPSFTEIAPGDLIFFDWNGKGTAQHVGFVIGKDADGYIYTVEGNAGDMVKIKKYDTANPFIMGYGTIT